MKTEKLVEQRIEKHLELREESPKNDMNVQVIDNNVPVVINGDDTKFYDYFKSVNRTDMEYIDCDNYAIMPNNILDLIQNVDNDFDINKLKDKMFFDENGIKNYTKYLFLKLNN